MLPSYDDWIKALEDRKQDRISFEDYQNVLKQYLICVIIGDDKKRNETRSNKKKTRMS